RMQATGSVDLDCHWHRLQRCDGGALRSLRLGALGGLILTYPSNTGAPAKVRRGPETPSNSSIRSAQRRAESRPSEVRPGPNVFPNLKPVRFIERPAGYRSLSGAPLCGEPIRTHIFSQMLRAAYVLCAGFRTPARSPSAQHARRPVGRRSKPCTFADIGLGSAHSIGQ